MAEDRDPNQEYNLFEENGTMRYYKLKNGRGPAKKKDVQTEEVLAKKRSKKRSKKW